MDRCSDFMTQDPICCVQDESVDRAAQIMLAEDIGSIPIVDDADTRKLIGILTDRDIALRIVAEARDPRQTAVREVMSSTPLFCRVDDDVQRAIELMADDQIRRIPIVDARQRVVGIIAQGDVATRLNQAETTAHVVKEISRRAVEA
jgi:CBS domain-containing protein